MICRRDDYVRFEHNGVITFGTIDSISNIDCSDLDGIKMNFDIKITQSDEIIKDIPDNKIVARTESSEVYEQVFKEYVEKFINGLKNETEI